MYYKGIYHLFYQYNPKGSVWGNIVWAHSVSKDLINWRSLEHALYPSKPFDKFGCWSGSATIVPGKGPVILYTGVVDDKQTQVQCYAIPEDLNDPLLQKWVKPDKFNPILVANKGVNGSAFRDPTTAWLSKDGHWKILVGSRKNLTGIAYLYRSKDFMNWVQAKHPIHSKGATGMWECPDFYPVLLRGNAGLETSEEGNHVKYVFKNSLDITRFDYYTVGTYFKDKDRYVPDNTSEDGWGGLRYDYGNFYASKSFFDPSKNRRILWGWANESDTKEDDVRKGWAGIQADVEVTFSFASLDKAETYDPKWVNAQDLCALKGSKLQGGVGPFGLLTLASQNFEEFTPVFFRIFKGPDKHVVLLCSDARSSSLKSSMYKPSFAGFVDVDLATKRKLSLRSLIDHSVVESFGEGGKTNILSRVYPQLAVANQAQLFVFNNGTEPISVENLKAWSMNPADIK
ncbi:Beta-fructofuranosidase, insoluble isoenzyme 1 [Glycine soja]|nr:Beta-fructofuranosidase, insoluble isoenzyme 1 [Glycine soja]